MKFRFRVYRVIAVLSLLLVFPLALIMNSFAAGFSSMPDRSLPADLAGWVLFIGIGCTGSLFMLPITALVSVVIVAAGRLFGLTPKERAIDQCSSCGYSLTGNTSGRCPECGGAIPLQNRRK